MLITIRNFGLFWENDLKHTTQHFTILIFLLWHNKVVIMIIVEFPIICFDFGCGKKIIKSWILHIRLSTTRNFGPFWENDLRHTPQHFRILILLLWHHKVVIVIIVVFPIICFDFGCGKKIIIKSWILHIRLSTIWNFGPFWENDLRHTPQYFRIFISFIGALESGDNVN